MFNCCIFCEEPERGSALTTPGTRFDVPSNKAGDDRRAKFKSAKTAESRMNVFASHIDVEDTYEAPNYPKSDEAIEFITKHLNEVCIFSNLSEKCQNLLVGAMQAENVEEGAVIIQQGDIGDYFYLVEEGRITFYVNGVAAGSSSAGASFGELALLYNAPRAATCTASTDCRLWKVDQTTFRQMIASHNKKQTKTVLDVLNKLPLLRNLRSGLFTKFFNAMNDVCFRKGSDLATKGERAHEFFIISHGTAKMGDRALGPGDHFGIDNMLKDGVWEETVKTTTRCTCFVLNRETVEKNLGPLLELIAMALKRKVLAELPSVKKNQCSLRTIEKIADLMTEENYHKDEVIAAEGDHTVARLIIVAKGKLTLSRNKEQTETFQDGTYINNLRAEEGAMNEFTITAEEESTCYVLTHSQLDSMGVTIDKKQMKIKADDLKKLRVLGLGSFGTVWLVRHKTTDKTYADKMLDKSMIIKNRQVKNVLREKEIMASIDHPFIVNLVGTYQDHHFLYLIQELMQGGELFTVIHGHGKSALDQPSAVFYAACVLEGLGHMHRRDICYRDLKPENLLMDAQGYCLIADLGFAKVVKDKTYTLCGTPEYLAPEIILSQGHAKGVDYWAYGVLIYEMLLGRSPFHENGMNNSALFKRIVKVKYSFPKPRSWDNNSKDLIKKLLIKRESDRIGCLAGEENDIRKHPFLDSIDTEKLLAKQIRAPWVPKIKNSVDSSNFDSYRQEEQADYTNRRKLSQSEQKVFENF